MCLTDAPKSLLLWYGGPYALGFFWRYSPSIPGANTFIVSFRGVLGPWDCGALDIWTQRYVKQKVHTSNKRQLFYILLGFRCGLKYNPLLRILVRFQKLYMPLEPREEEPRQPHDYQWPMGLFLGVLGRLGSPSLGFSICCWLLSGWGLFALGLQASPTEASVSFLSGSFSMVIKCSVGLHRSGPCHGPRMSSAHGKC